MMEDSDAAVVERVRKGDTETFRILVERHSHAIFRLAFRMTANEEDAEDVVQETFLRAYRNLGRFEFRSSFPVWLHRIAANVAMDLLRWRKRQPPGHARADGDYEPLPELQTGLAGPDGAAADSEFNRELEAALGQLTPQERAAFALRHFEGKSIQEISSALRLRPNAAKNSIFRAVQKVRRELAPLFHETK